MSASLLSVGDVLPNGFVLQMLLRDEDGRILVECPNCGEHVWRYRKNLPRMQSCGCKGRATRVTRAPLPRVAPKAVDLEPYRATVEAARVAFATDIAYAIAFARAKSNIDTRSQAQSRTL